MDGQIVNAIQIAWDTNAAQGLKSQAFAFLNTIRVDPQAWLPCLNIVIDTPRSADIVRHVSLEMVINAFKGGLISANDQISLKEKLLGHLRVVANSGVSRENEESLVMLNKFTQLLIELFSRQYADVWQSFFLDMRTITNTEHGHEFDRIGTGFYLRLLSGIHDEIGDTLVPRTKEEQQHCNMLKDLVREKDTESISQLWQRLLSDTQVPTDDLALCLRVMGQWASWSDLSFIVQPPFTNLLGQALLSQPGSNDKLRNIATTSFMEVVSKKMKPPEKIELFKSLSVMNVLSQLAASPALENARFTPDYDVDYAEIVSKLVAEIVIDIVKVLENVPTGSELSALANQYLKNVMPLVIRFFSDEYDEVCGSMILSVTDILAYLKKHYNDDPQYPEILPAILKATITKMRFDDTADFSGEDSNTDEAEFMDLRRRLENTQHSVSLIDEQLFTSTVVGIVKTAFSAYSANPSQVNWRDIELAMIEVYFFGTVALKSGTLYSKTKPTTPTQQELINMLEIVLNSGIVTHRHVAIQLLYMELCERYFVFFSRNTQYIPQILEGFVQFIRSNSIKVRSRARYLFFKLVKNLRVNIGNIAQSVLNATQDLLDIPRIDPPIPKVRDDSETTDSSEQQQADAEIERQLYLYEALAIVSTTNAVPIETQIACIQAALKPVLQEIRSDAAAASTGDERALYHIWHLMKAVGLTAHGIVDSTPGDLSKTTTVNAAIAAELETASEVILGTLTALNSHAYVREGASFAFARLIPVLGLRILPQLPRWIDGFFVDKSSTDEIATLLRTLGQLIYGFGPAIGSILNTLFRPLFTRLLSRLMKDVTGTDDAIQQQELKMQYMSFLQIIFHHGLASILVSAENQPIFTSIISTLESFARPPEIDHEALAPARAALTTLITMVSTWGGPDIRPGDPQGPASPQPVLPGFENYMIATFSPLTWALPSNPLLMYRDAMGAQILSEAAGLQKTIFAKTGDMYLNYLKEQELKNMGMDDGMIDEYTSMLVRLEYKSFQQFFKNLIARTRAR